MSASSLFAICSNKFAFKKRCTEATLHMSEHCTEAFASKRFVALIQQAKISLFLKTGHISIDSH